MKDNAQLINQDSGNTEYYTPMDIVDMAREVMGGIDLDPFSSEQANERVKAKKYYTIEDDGLLNRIWEGRLWINHPFGRKMNKQVIEKLVRQYEMGYISQACCITFAATSEKWFRPLLQYPQCFIHGRTNYYLPDGTIKKGVTKGSVVTYLGDNVEKFKEVFSEIGTVKI
jgi:hypothetical protein